MNRTLYYGEGLFETIRWRGENRKLKLHYSRLSSSAEALGIPCPSYEDFVSEIKTAVGGSMNKNIKFCLFSEGEDYFGGSPSAYRTQVLVRELPQAPRSVRLCISKYRRHSANPVYRHKSMNYMFNILVKREACQRGFFDGVILNERDNITECSSSNIVILKKGKLLTPHREEGLLRGTTLELLSREIELEEVPIGLGELFEAEAIFILNSLMGAVPVVKLENRSLSLSTEILRKLNSKIEEYEVGL
jgi:4-amino-4-deoxychorismate lyase